MQVFLLFHQKQFLIATKSFAMLVFQFFVVAKWFSKVFIHNNYTIIVILQVMI